MSGGGGRGGRIFDSNNTPEKIAERIRKAEQNTLDASFKAEVNAFLGHELASYNDRDVELVNRRLDDVLSVLGSEVEGSITTNFGGSVAKHTYVDGLSDIDCLLFVTETELQDSAPKDILKYCVDALRDDLRDAKNITAGNMAITVEYGDGMQIQLLPALKSRSGATRVAGPDPETWSEINPERFDEKLTSVNGATNGKLVPVIKLAKSVISQTRGLELTGYHVESLAIDAFRRYDGPLDPKSMLGHFFDHATEGVREPIRDSSGQSVHVDGYLGATDSPTRLKSSEALNRIAKRIKNADAMQSVDQWTHLFDD